MTVTLTLNDVTTVWSDEYTSNSFDLGIINNENISVNNGTEILSLTSKSSEDTMSFNTKGQTRTLNITATFTGTTSEIREFTKKLKICSDNQVESLLNETISSSVQYVNTKSRIYPIYDTGIKCVIKSFSINSRDNESPSMITYNLTLLETKGEF